jgi:hypothetical protein
MNRFEPFTDEELLELAIYFGVNSQMSSELIEERTRRHKTQKPTPIVIGLQGIEAPPLKIME